MSGQPGDCLAGPEPSEEPAIAVAGSYRTADPRTLRRAYDRCRRTAAAHGRTYYLATRLLAAEQRPAVHALYAFARMVDDIVDVPASAPGRDPAAMLDFVELSLRTSWSPPTATAVPGPLRPGTLPPLGTPGPGPTAPLGAPGPGPTRPFRPPGLDTTPQLDPPRPCATAPLDPPRPDGPVPHDPPGPGRPPAGFDDVLLALTDTVARFSIDPRHFRTFLDSMRMDVPGSPMFRDRYPNMAALDEYMQGSAAAIGLLLLPVLGTVGPRAAAEPAAAALGNAFQLTNFLRDIGEDLDRGRIYLPADELAAFGVDEELLMYCRRTRRTDRRVRRALAHLIAVNRAGYRRAHPGIDLLSPRVRPGIRTAATVYSAILDRMEESGYDVFARRAVVPGPRRLRLAARAAMHR